MWSFVMMVGGKWKILIVVLRKFKVGFMVKCVILD